MFAVDEAGHRLVIPVLKCPALKPKTWRRVTRLYVARGAFSKGEKRLSEFLWSLGGAARNTGLILDRSGQPMSGTELEGRYCRRFGVCRAIFWADWAALEVRGLVYRAVAPAMTAHGPRHAEYGICLRADAVPDKLRGLEELAQLMRVEELAYTEPAPEAVDAYAGSIADFARKQGPMQRVKPLSRNQCRRLRRQLNRARTCGYREINSFTPTTIKLDTSPLYVRGDSLVTSTLSPAVTYQLRSTGQAVENQKTTRQRAAGPGSIFTPPAEVVREAEKIVRRAQAMSWNILGQDFMAGLDAANRASFVELVAWNLINLTAAGHRAERVVLAQICGAMRGETVISPFLAACKRLWRNVTRRLRPEDLPRLKPTGDRRELLARRADYLLPQLPRAPRPAGYEYRGSLLPPSLVVPSPAAADGAVTAPAAPAEDLTTWARRFGIAELDQEQGQDDEAERARARAAILAFVDEGQDDAAEAGAAEAGAAAAEDPDRAAVKAVACPKCAAAAGSPCRFVGTRGIKTMDHVHPSRIAAANGAA